MFALKIATDNTAFGFGAGREVARILRTLADRLENADDDMGPVMDFNGNTVGSFELGAEGAPPRKRIR